MASILDELRAARTAIKDGLKEGKIWEPPPPVKSKLAKAKAQADIDEKADEMAIGTALKNCATVHRRKVKEIVLNEEGIAAGMEQIKRLPEPGESLHCIMGGHYHGFDVIPIIQRLSGRAIRTLTLATLGFSKKNTQQLCLMAENGQITGRVDVLASEYFAKADANIYVAAKEAIEALPAGGRLEFTRNHAKIILADCGRGHRYVVESSANLRSCVSLEQFQINNDAGLFRFHRRWIAAMIRNPDQ